MVSPECPAPEPRVLSRGVIILRRLAAVLLIAIWIAGALIIAVTLRNERWDAGMKAGVVAVVVALVSLITFLWFVTLAPVRRSLRLGMGGVGLLIGILLASLFRLDGVDGSLRPQFVPRWATKPDRQLAQPTVGTEPASVDLVTITQNDFPQFLGPNRNQAIDYLELTDDWQSHPPQVVWRQPIGAGWSGFAAVNGYAVTLEQRDTEECVTCYEIGSGKPVWSHGVSTRHETTLGGVGPRATPTLDEGRVYAIGATGVLRCLDGSNGDAQWQHDLVAELQIRDDSESIAWGRSGSPLIVDNRVIVPGGGPKNGLKATLIAFDKVTGHEIWRGGEAQISYASPTLATLNGKRQILYVAENQVMGLDPETGRVLWSHEWPGNSTANASASNAVPIDERRVFLSKSYGQGSAVIEVSCDAQQLWSAKDVWSDPTRMKTKFSNVVFYEGAIFGFDDTMLQCIDAETGERRWKRGRFGFSQLLRVGDKLLIAGENGELALVDTSQNGFHQFGSIPALSGKTWNNPCLYGDLVLLRNSTEAACYRLTLKDEAAP